LTITASELRQNVYRLLDEVLRTGEPLEIDRAGRRLRIVPVDAPLAGRNSEVVEVNRRVPRVLSASRVRAATMARSQPTGDESPSTRWRQWSRTGEPPS
jgi:antitoxin (DNA-binding transcriptional repressor) of toxin-antitoxin stability system